MREFIFIILLALASSTYAGQDHIPVYWELNLQENENREILSIELTKEKGESCLISNPMKLKVIKGKTPSNAYFSGYTYSINGNTLEIDMEPMICDSGNLLVGKLNGKSIEGVIFSSSIAGLQSIGTFEGIAVE